MGRTKIVCTIGPATSSESMIEKLILAGMDVARLNFSHGTHEEHAHTIRTIRALSGRLHKPIAILQDLQGPKLRTGRMKRGSALLKKGDRIAITIEDVPGDERIISTSYPHLPGDVRIGDIILLDDGLIQLIVKHIEAKQVICEISEGGVLSDHKGMNLPNVSISQSSLTDKDIGDLHFGIGQNVDLVALSFVRSANDVQLAKDVIRGRGEQIQVIAKLEKPEAIAHMDDILHVSDGVMVARGDLGVEIPLEKVPSLQKEIIRLAICRGKPVITATQMLESMRDHTRPTRAEVSDVANAIFDGTDAVMLSAETAVGKHPIMAVSTMDRIIEEAERTIKSWGHHQMTGDCGVNSIPDAISRSACEAAEGLKARAIVAFTKSGFTAKMVAKYRPQSTVIAFTPSEIVSRQLNLSWGIIPMNMEFVNSSEEIIHRTEKILLSRELVKNGDLVVVLMGSPPDVQGTTNLMKLHTIGG